MSRRDPEALQAEIAWAEARLAETCWFLAVDFDKAQWRGVFGGPYSARDIVLGYP